MELSKRALGFLSRQYRIILSQNRLANVLGTCALSALMCATGLTTAAFVAPENAVAATTGVTIPAGTESWSSTGDISVGSTSDQEVAGIYAEPTGSLSITLASGHTITVTSDVTGGGGAAAVGIFAYATKGDNDITNNGIITTTATATTGAANAFGIMGVAKTNNNYITKGTINAHATATTGIANAYGISTGIVLTTPPTISATNKNITNGGTINATATATATTGKANAYGIFALANSNKNITNGGTINATATATTGKANAYGIFALANSNKNITNDGTITVTASATTGNAYAFGISTGDVLTPPPTLSGTNKNITNKAKIIATATGDNAIACGISALATSNNTIINNGTIHATAIATVGEAGAAGIMAEATNGDNDITNNGTITVTATGDKVVACGMCTDGTSATINNFGFINVSAAGKKIKAYQAYVESGTANVGTWALKLGETYGKRKGFVFGVESGAKLIFGVGGKGANFIISGVGEDFEPSVAYDIKDMVDNGANVSGYIASVSSRFDFLPVELIGSGKYKKQSIKATLDLSKDNSPTHGGATQLLANLKGHMSGLGKVIGNQRGNSGGVDGLQAAKSETSTMYADASTTFTDAGGSYLSPESPVWKAFLMPFYSTTSDNGGAYDTDMAGLVAGASRNLNDDFVFGFHVSLAKANGEGAYTDSDTLSYALGVNGVYNIDKSLYVRGQLTGFFAENDFDMVSSTSPWGHNASAEMDTYGVYAELAAGYDIVLAPQHMLTPELALSYLYAHMEGFDSDFNGTAFSMASENYDALYADASVRWTGTYDLGMSENGNNLGILKPTVKAGIRQALADPEVSSTMNVFGTSATTHADANETSFTCEAGLAWTLDALTLSAIYSGEFGDVEYSHMGMFKVEWEF